VWCVIHSKKFSVMPFTCQILHGTAEVMFLRNWDRRFSSKRSRALLMANSKTLPGGGSFFVRLNATTSLQPISNRLSLCAGTLRPLSVNSAAPAVIHTLWLLGPYTLFVI
jgi:hypothetical protein